MLRILKAKKGSADAEPFHVLIDRSGRNIRHISIGADQLKSGVERYLSPESGRRTTILFPAFSGLDATCAAAQSAAPEEMPVRTPSVRASALPSWKAASLGHLMISS